MISDITSQIPLDSTSITIPITMLWAGILAGATFIGGTVATAVWQWGRIWAVLKSIQRAQRSDWSLADMREWTHRAAKENPSVNFPGPDRVHREMRGSESGSIKSAS